METARDILGKREANMKRLEKEAPNLCHGFSEFITYCVKPGALDRKQKELMAVAATVAVRCIPCLAHHANNAIKAGATRIYEEGLRVRYLCLQSRWLAEVFRRT